MEASKHKIKIGFAPTRRMVFSREDALKYKGLAKARLGALGFEYVDLEWLNAEGLLYDPADSGKVADKFAAEGVDAVFSPHCNFGTEDAVAKLAKKMGKPFLLWGPRDEAPLADGSRLRDSQCGLFATSKALRRLGVPFTYLENRGVDDPVFETGLKNFTAAAAVVKQFRNLRIGQIGVRPAAFWSVMANEAELLEKYGIEIVPISLVEITGMLNGLIQKKDPRIPAAMADYKKRINCAAIKDDALATMTALKFAIGDWAGVEGLSAVAIQCWNALQDAAGVMPCFADAELTGEGLPVACETDICGAVTAALVQAAGMGRTPVFFADLTVRHPQNDNAELLWHCGPFPYQLKKEGAPASLGSHYVLESGCPGVAEWEIKGGNITICRFDGSGGRYSLLAAQGRGVEGPRNRGTYVWVEFKDWPALERRIIEGPYIHHVAGIHGHIIPVMREALRYLPGIEGEMVE